MWNETEARLVKACKIFDLYESKRISRKGHEGIFYLLKSNDWVNIVPLIIESGGEKSFLMVKQYRHGAEQLTVEFPAGLVEKGESPEQAAERELLEETGFKAGSLKLIGKISPNPAFMSNWCHTYLAEGLDKVDDPDLDELEHLEIMNVQPAHLISMIGKNGYINSMTFIALQWWLRLKG